jgi:hypothetical protein
MPLTLRVLPWSDPVIDTLGHDPRSLYVETFLLPTLGPTCVLLSRHLAQRFELEPGGFDVDVAETSVVLGLGPREGNQSPVMRTLLRLAQFDLATPHSIGPTAASVGPEAAAAATPSTHVALTATPGAGGRGSLRPADIGTWLVRRAFPPVNRRHVGRLTPRLQIALQTWNDPHTGSTPLEVARRRARQCAFVLLEAGADLDVAERRLVGMGFHPALCRAAAEWAAARHRAADELLGEVRA